MRQHTAAVAAVIRSIPALASKTYVGAAPKDGAGKLPAAPLVVIYAADGIDTQERYTGPRATQHPRFTLHIVGSSHDNTQTIASAVKAKFVVNGFGVAPAVEGERTSDLVWESPLPVQYDTDVVPPVPYQVVELQFDAWPA
jgi:hypothetical protein